MRSVGSNTHHQHQIKNYERWVCPDCEKEQFRAYACVGSNARADGGAVDYQFDEYRALRFRQGTVCRANTAPVEEQKMTEVRERLTELFPAHVIMRDNVYYHVNVMTVKMTVDGVEQTYYFGLRLDEFGLWQLIELAENEVGEDTLVQK